MCGINGLLEKNENLIRKMMESTSHRGPDGKGFFCDDYISLGHNLLAITEDPSNSSQPFFSSDNRYVLVYNGEIFNTNSLKKELQSLNYTFLTKSDTEVLLYGLIEFGSSFLDKIDGMFALAFYDKKKKKLILARDSFGIKPLYYYKTNNFFIFSSEIKGLFSANIPRNLNKESASTYFLLGYVPGKETLIDNVYKLLPGECQIINAKTKEIKNKWINIGHRKQSNIQNIHESIKISIENSIIEKTSGLRPFGLFLSGGIDSSIIFQKIAKTFKKDSFQTFTTRFETLNDRYNEDADIAKKLSDSYGIKHTELLITQKEFVDSIVPTIRTIEEPRWNPSIPSYWLLSKKACKDIVVVLNGSGGDELFFGYKKYADSRKIANFYKYVPNIIGDILFSLKLAINGRIDFFSLIKMSDFLQRWIYINCIRYRIDINLFPGIPRRNIIYLYKQLKKLQLPSIKNPLVDTENAIAELDRNFWLDSEEFARTDKITMKFSMEGRFPFMSQDVVKISNNIPSFLKYRDQIFKKLLKESFSNDLPSYVLKKRKTGWSAPVSEWMEEEFGEFIMNVLEDNYHEATNQLFNLKLIRNKITRRKYSTAELKDVLPIAMFRIWAKEFEIQISHD